MDHGQIDSVYLTESMGVIGEAVFSIQCVVSSIPMTIYVFGLSGYVALLAHLGASGSPYGRVWGLRVVMVAAVTGWSAGGSEVKSVNRGPCG